MGIIATTKAKRFTRLAMYAVLGLSLLTASLGATPATAAQANLAWTAPTTGTISGYKLHIGSSSGSYDQHINVGNSTTYSASSLVDGNTYYFAVSAYDASGAESTYSNELVKSFAALPLTYTISASAGAGGSITALNNTKVSTASSGTTTITSVTVSDGASQSFSIAPATGYKISAVTVDGTSVGAVSSYTFSTVKANHTISATFTAATSSYSITASAGTGGSITPSGTSSVTSGGSKSFTIAPATGYKIAAVTVDGTSVGAVSSYTFSNVTANHTISATFTASISSYSITASAGTGGSISPSGTATVSAGTGKSYSIAAATGYKVLDVKVDGASVGAVTSYTFSNVTANHTIAASFTAVAGKVVFATNSGGAAYTDSTAAYKADTSYSGGSVKTSTSSIANTTSDVLYQSYRYGNSFGYNVPLANGNYSVTLKFADNSAIGTRVFNVAMEGSTVISNLDIYAKAGNNTAYDVTIPVSVADGTLNINFVSKIGNAKINAILVKTR